MHENDMDRFVEEQKAKLAEERRNLENNPTSAVSGYYADRSGRDKIDNRNIGEQIIPSQQKAFVDNSPQAVSNLRPETPKIFKLGEDYKRFRNHLNQERQQDYAQQQNKGNQNNYARNQQPAVTQGVERPEYVKQSSDLGLSLPIRDHLSAQERLRRERNREYNDLLQRNRGGARTNRDNYQQQQPQQRPPPQQQQPQANIIGQPVRTEATKIFLPELPTTIGEQRNQTDEDRRLEADEYVLAKKREADEYVRAKKRDAESYQELLDRKRLEEKLYRKEPDDYTPREVEYVPVRRRPVRRRPSRYYDDEYDDDYYDALDEELYHRLKNRRPRVIRHVIDDDESSTTTTPQVVVVGGSNRKNINREAPARSEKRQTNSAEQRSRNGAPSQVDYNRNVKESYDTPGEVRSKSAPPDPDQEFTGLPIGEKENYASANKKKEQYRRELEQQMRENQQRKINDKNRERSEDRSSDREEYNKPKRVTYADEREDKRAQRRRSDSESEAYNTRRSLPPRPILNQSNQPSVVGSYRTPPPAPPQQAPTDITSPHDQAYFYYGTRNPLDPSFASVGVQPTTASYPPHPISVPTTQGSNVGNSLSPNQKSNDLVIKSLNGQTGLFINDDSQENANKQQKQISYQEELRRQVEEKKREKELRKAEQERYDRRKDKEAREYNPWGKGGGGAPMRDLTGKPISDLRQFRQTNGDTTSIQQQQQPEPAAPVTVEPIALSPRYNDTTDGLQNTPRFGRSNPFENKETAVQKTQKDVYKEELQRQIDERKRVEAEKKERLRLEEEKEEKRLEEQNRKMQEEFEIEQRKKQEKIEEQKRKNEELQRQIEEQKREEERKRRELNSNRDEEIRREKDRELDNKLKQATPRQSQVVRSSRKPVVAEGEKIPRTPVGRPPVSTRKQLTNRPTDRPQETNRKSQNRVTSRSDAAPSPHQQQQPQRDTPRYIYSRDSTRISRGLSALRRQLLDEQRRIENQLGADDDEFKINSQILDLSRMRQQRPVQVIRRPRPPVLDTNREVPDQMALKEFNDFKYQNDETSTLRIFKSEYPEQPVDAESFEKQQQELIRTQIRNLEALKSPNQSVQPPVVIQAAPIRRSSPPPIPPQKQPQYQSNNYLSPPHTSSGDSLLETETTYIPISDTLPPTPQPQKRGARERRRADRGGDKENKERLDDPPSVASLTISDVELLAGKNQRRLTNLQDPIPADSISLNDPDEILSQFVTSQKNPKNESIGISKESKRRSASVTTVESEPWLRPESRN